MSEKIKTYIGMRHFFLKQFFVSFVLMLIPLLICSFVIANLYESRIDKEIDMQIFEQTYLAASVTEGTFKSIHEFHERLISSEELEMFLSFSNDMSSFEKERRITNIISFMRDFMYFSQYNENIYIYNAKNDFVCAYTLMGTGTSDKFRDFDWYHQYISDGKNLFKREIDILGRKIPYITYCIPLDGIGYDNSVVAYNIKGDLLAEFVNENIGNIYIIDSNDSRILYSTDKDVRIEKFDEAISVYKNEGYNTGLTKLHNGQYITYVSSADLYIISERNDNRVGFDYSFILISLIIIAFLFAFIISLIITNKFYSAIIKITRVLRYPDEVMDKSEDDKDEISFIIKNISDISKKSNEFEVSFAKGMAQMKEIQAVALQFQITPHFLLNTLQLINVLEIEENKRDTKVVQVVMKLSEILRYVLDTKTYFVSLEEEIAYIKLYVEIQRLKYPNKFEVVWDIPEDVIKLQVIKFILQPLVENAIFHGINPSEEKGTLWIRAEKKQDELYIYVENDGILISQEMIDILNASEPDQLRKSKNFGFTNVKKRLSVMYGEEYGCNIGLSNGKTSVCLLMPAREMNEENGNV